MESPQDARDSATKSRHMNPRSGSLCWRCTLRLSGCKDLRQYLFFNSSCDFRDPPSCSSPSHPRGDRSSEEGGWTASSSHLPLQGNQEIASECPKQANHIASSCSSKTESSLYWELTLCHCEPSAAGHVPRNSNFHSDCPSCFGLCWLDCGFLANSSFCLTRAYGLQLESLAQRLRVRDAECYSKSDSPPSLQNVTGDYRGLPVHAKSLAQLLLLSAMGRHSPESLLKCNGHVSNTDAAAATAVAEEAVRKNALILEAEGANFALTRQWFLQHVEVELPHFIECFSGPDCSDGTGLRSDTPHRRVHESCYSKMVETNCDKSEGSAPTRGISVEYLVKVQVLLALLRCGVKLLTKKLNSSVATTNIHPSNTQTCKKGIFEKESQVQRRPDWAAPEQCVISLFFQQTGTTSSLKETLLKPEVAVPRSEKSCLFLISSVRVSFRLESVIICGEGALH